ncbi:type VII secretion-associated serine protease mycosin [Streptomyces sp. NPDC049577]|uniref:type VII secretion-associated serine protease mycosin n=1 Tax=Streptomyces sp. NPDC049577 TaxID=3155153 RepID=UPI003426FCD9
MHSTQQRRVNRWRTAATVLLLLGAFCPEARADTVRSQQWYLDAMRADEMWKTSTGAGVTVAVVDSGVADVPDLRGQVLEGRDFTGQPGSARTDIDGHGTRMALFIAGTGQGDGSFGLAPGVKILPLRASADQDFASGSRAVASAIRYAADSNAKVINISLASAGQSPEEDEAVRYAVSKGKLIFAGVGNTGDKGNLVQYPAATPGVVGVAAVDRQIKATSWSQHGPQVDLAAPGADMVAPCTDGSPGLCTGDGTSDSTALASASAALLWSVHPEWTANQVLRVLINTAGGPKSGEKRSDSIGYGVVRPRVALQSPGDPGPPDVSPLPESVAPVTRETAAPPGARTKRATGLVSSSATPIAAGAVIACIALAVGAGVAVSRRRRRNG